MLLLWRRKYFTQANETPLASVDSNDELRKEDVQEAILNGEYCVGDSVHETIKDIFKQMQRPSSIHSEINFESNYEDFRTFIKGASEKNINVSNRARIQSP